MNIPEILVANGTGAVLVSFLLLLRVRGESKNSVGTALFCRILVVTLLLMLPISSQSRTVTPPLTALFTATSAVCVTGQVLVDTGMHWSLFGQVVLIAAIQIGGLGVMTLLASLLTGVLTDAVITEISVTGSLMIIGITLNVLGVTKLRILNMTPALLLPVLLCKFM